MTKDNIYTKLAEEKSDKFLKHFALIDSHYVSPLMPLHHMGGLERDDDISSN